ncbi:MAG TPA: ClcB-like voltage-gated chloride channel protein [Planctomycetota bacterium]|nr:ClcB-like voltage-gated chloride channel protein [Planctomycetota bacterium]
MRFPKLRFRLAEVLRPRDVHVTLFWAGIVGFVGACTSAAFRGLSMALTELFFGAPGSVVSAANQAPWWQTLIVPAAGGLLAGLVLEIGLRWTREKPALDFMEAVSIGDGTIHVAPSLVRSLSSLFSVASGGSIGREGAMAQLSTTAASWIGRRTWISRPRLKLLVACGAAAGIASAYNAPFAGALFVAEIVLGTISMSSLGPLIFASVVATGTTHEIFGPEPLFPGLVFKLASPLELFPYLVLGVLLGALAPAFVRLLRLSVDAFAKSKVPLPIRLFLGGAMVGGLALASTEVLGNGYNSLGSVIAGNLTVSMVALVVVLKLIATCATVGSGAVGGVFTPTLFFGAGAGYLWGSGVHGLLPAWTAHPSAYALVGMGSFLAATTQAPLMSMLVLFEMTLDYGIVLPLMVASVMAYTTARGISPNSIYSRSLANGGVDPEDALIAGTIATLVKPKVVTVNQHARFQAIVEAFQEHRHSYLYVVDDDGRFMGAVSLHDVKPFLSDPTLADLIIASEIMHEDFVFVERDATLAETMQAFLREDGERLPVVDGHGGRMLVGSVSRTDLMLALSLGAHPRPEAAEAPK